MSQPEPALVSVASEQALEFPSLLALVAQLAASDLGQERILELRPFLEIESLEAHRQRYREARRMLAVRPLVPSRERPLAPILKALDGHGQALHGRDLVEIGSMLRASSQAAKRIAEAEPPCPALTELASAAPPLDNLLKLLVRTFDARGEIREDATPLLAELRGRIRSVRQRIYDKLGSLVEQHRDHLSEETIPVRSGRMVLMLQSGARGKVPGLVHGRSGRGHSYYFEPLDAVEDNNSLQGATEDEEAEKQRILAEVLESLRSELSAIEAHAQRIADFDLLQASVRFAESCGGHLADLAARHELMLKRARHPLLDPALADLRRQALGVPGHTGEIIPLDLALEPELRALILTGPNAGGKTVALKTLGLLALAHQCGLPIPAEKGSRLPFLSALVATVGDDQDLLADRSTFSGRLLRLKEAWDAAAEDALILLDELGSGTDPEEGAALSTALMEALVDRRSLVLITTHLSQVAAAALETEGAGCAAMQFDGSTGAPTYRLIPGPPGGSEALALAHRLGLPAPWLKRADELLGSDHRDLRRLLAEVERHREELADARGELEGELKDARILRQRLAERDAELLAERKAIGKKLRLQLEDFQRDTRARLRSEVEKMTAALQQGRRRGLAAEATERLFAEAPVLEPVSSEPEVALTLGVRVRHRRLGWTGTLQKLDRGRAQVDVDGKALLCKEKDLTADDGSGNSEEPRKRPPQRSRTQGSRTPSSISKQTDASEELAPTSELNLIGWRVEPALDSLDRFLDRALLSSVNSVRIIHGHGSGRLRLSVRDHLKGHPAVLSHRPGKANEGGDGATIVVLDD